MSNLSQLIPRKKRLLKISGILVILTLTLATLAINYMAIQIASPPPSKIPPSTTTILETPEKYGIVIHKLACLNGKVPTLIIEPAPTHPISTKGALVRKQLTARGTTLTKYGTIRGTVVILHGRTGRKENGIGIAERFCAAGLRCILVDLPSHGESPVKNVKFGTTNWEQDIPYQVLTECANHFHFSKENTALWGMSMGGSFATSTATDPEHGHTWTSITIVCSFDSLTHIIKRKCKFNWLTNLTSTLCIYHGGADFSKVQPANWAKQILTPTLVVHGNTDELIPEPRGKFLYQSFASPDKKYLTVKGANHNNILITPMPLYAEMADWILTHF
ncbi:MAG: alpha/beta hydrolase [Akkermansiaceae bacterium]